MTRPIMLLSAFALSTFAPAQAQPPRVPSRQIALTPPAGFVPAYQARQGRQTIVEFVPRGQSVKLYNRMITLQMFPVARGVSADATLATFSRNYAARCPKARVLAVPLALGNRGVRIDCDRHPATGRAETVFARAIALAPEMALVHATSTYFVMPPEAGATRDFLGRVAVR